MENASKAILIAGGILFAMIIVALLLYLFNSMNLMGQADEDRKAAQQLAKFNAEYEAYNKKLMYGTDVITVINKAIDNNKMEDDNQKAGRYINVIVTVSHPYTTTIKEERIDTVNGKPQPGYPQTWEDGSIGKKLDAGTHELIAAGALFDRNRYVVKFFENDAKDTVKKPNVGEAGYVPGYAVTIYEYNALTQFKRSTFRCDGIDYDASGRIECIRISEVRQIEF